MKQMPDNPEMPYWSAITLAQNGQMEEALRLLKPVFDADPNWKELTRRLPVTGLLKLSDENLKKILEL
jgi:hypothetical protein